MENDLRYKVMTLAVLYMRTTLFVTLKILLGLPSLPIWLRAEAMKVLAQIGDARVMIKELGVKQNYAFGQ